MTGPDQIPDPVQGRALPPLSRRQILQGAAAASAGAALPAVTAGSAQAARRAGPARRIRVAVLGGGMSGLAAAHELAERGFDVAVYERKALGGKARSIAVPGTGTGGRRPLQGEHGFRFFPGFYRHVTDSMRRTPFPGNPHGVHDNLHGISSGRMSRNGGRADLWLPKLTGRGAERLDLGSLTQILTGLAQQATAIPPAELAFFVNRFLVFMTSSDERRYGQWENVAWWDYMRAQGKSADYRAILVKFLTTGLVAIKEEVANTRTVGKVGEAFVMSALGRGTDGELARMFNAPTNEAWIDPWVSHLRGRGVRFHLGQTVQALQVKGGRIASAHAIGAAGKRRRIDADWFICAIPPNRARALLSCDVLAADPHLAGIKDLRTDWMNGLQFYLRKSPPQLGQVQALMDSPWQITTVLQSKLWDRDYPRTYGDGTVADCLSLDISDWDTPGILYRKPAKHCSPDQIAKEAWAQLKDHLEDTGVSVLPDKILHSWFLDPAIKWNPALGRNTNDEPLTVNTVGTWNKRPTARTKIPNLFMAGDYVQTNTDLATMEAANESARHAVNALIDTAEARAAHTKTWKLYQPPELADLRKLDARRYRAGQPHLLDT